MQFPTQVAEENSFRLKYKEVAPPEVTHCLFKIRFQKFKIFRQFFRVFEVICVDVGTRRREIFVIGGPKYNWDHETLSFPEEPFSGVVQAVIFFWKSSFNLESIRYLLGDLTKSHIITMILFYDIITSPCVLYINLTAKTKSSGLKRCFKNSCFK